ncbi:Acetyltransferase (GNAT) domain-containing protein [Nonomuraea jiangxiensis]|uniref:Acetyltransferase (GNAT) domain-containing protein n=1 Tax=Nonomuraea jiangxiensis TaxID=633440 RepID=A0A1G9M0G4_9ACTN|nr:Acetyltransferase (GNAT) domain-containing protein [Nonomuraea jiangxiensis]
MQGEVRVEPLPRETAADAAMMSMLTDLINEVYAAAEKGLWQGSAARTDPAELSRLTGAGEMFVARLDGRIVGCVRVRRLTDELSEFGMLTAAPETRGIGVGRALVRFAESHSRAQGRHTMRLELLMPRTWAHPSKEFLEGWYGRIGYRMVGMSEIEETYPDLAGLLATPCDFRVYQKDLRDQDG